MFKPTYISSSAPTANDDFSSGYRKGVGWWHTTNSDFYICEDDAVGAAVWQSVSGSSIDAWANFTPTLSWTGNTPTGVSYVARYQELGNTVMFTLDISGTNQAGASITGLESTLPETPEDNNNYVPISFIYDNNGSFGSSEAYIDCLDNTGVNRKLKHASFPTILENDAFNLYYRGFYEKDV